MATKIDKFNKQRLRSSNITVVVSISLVLFLIGLIGLIVINANNYVDYLKEQMVVEVYFKTDYDQTPDQKIDQEKQELAYLDSIKTMPFVKKAKYISSDEAVKIGKKELGVDTNELFERSIFPGEVSIVLKPDFVNPQSIDKIKLQLKNNPIVDEVKSDSKLLAKMYQQVNKITIGISVIAVIILLIAISLINNSIRLKIYAKRFIIKTMQLVGARRFFIMKPFLFQSFWLGFIGATVALILLFSLNYALIYKNILPGIKDLALYTWLSIGLYLLGIVITTVSTYFATWRFLKLRLDDLYYS